MNILVLNAGSSSHKLCLYKLGPTNGEEAVPPHWQAQIDWYPQKKTATINLQQGNHNVESEQVPFPSEQSQASILQTVLAKLTVGVSGGATPCLHSLSELDGVGHRIVHGGARYSSSVLITPEVKAAIADLIPLAPLHNPANLAGIELMEQLFSRLGASIPQFAVFDTAFHSTLPEPAYTYPGPYAWRKQGIRRYGFHGISHQYCAQRAAQLLNRSTQGLKLIICHLGNGASLSAVKDGKSIDTTMGFTPLEGLMMGTRSGSVDPGILLYLLKQGQTVEQLEQTLNHEAGLKGISGISHDFREIEQAITNGNPRAQLARDLYLHRFSACFGAMLMGLGGVDAIVFTAGLGEHSPAIRAHACKAMGFLGVEIDPAQNAASPIDQDIASASSKIRVLVIKTQEDWAIARNCWQLLQT